MFLLLKWLKGYAQLRLVWMNLMLVELELVDVDEWVLMNTMVGVLRVLTFEAVN